MLLGYVLTRRIFRRMQLEPLPPGTSGRRQQAGQRTGLASRTLCSRDRRLRYLTHRVTDHAVRWNIRALDFMSRHGDFEMEGDRPPVVKAMSFLPVYGLIALSLAILDFVLSQIGLDPARDGPTHWIATPARIVLMFCIAGLCISGIRSIALLRINGVPGLQRPTRWRPGRRVSMWLEPNDIDFVLQAAGTLAVALLTHG